ncbi:hypothetical protein BDZ97DRAFT_1915679 [Flammula alnicola]|nr:hypothetical protein BDZ97DRAFT_1915679 [Flammula alnicola]
MEDEILSETEPESQDVVPDTPSRKMEQVGRWAERTAEATEIAAKLVELGRNLPLSPLVPLPASSLPPSTPKSTVTRGLQEVTKTRPSPIADVSPISVRSRSVNNSIIPGSVVPGLIPGFLSPNHAPTTLQATTKTLLAVAGPSAPSVAAMSSSNSTGQMFPSPLPPSSKSHRRKKAMVRIVCEIKTLEEISFRLAYLYPKRDKLRKKLHRGD